MSKYLKVKDNPSYAKDTTNGSIINTNTGAYEQRLRQIEEQKKTIAAEKKFNEEFNTLKTDMHEIKDLLKNLLASNK